MLTPSSSCTCAIEARLFLLDEHAIVALHAQDRNTLRARLHESLRAEGLGDEVPALDRIEAFVDGTAEPHDADERRIAHLTRCSRY